MTTCQDIDLPEGVLKQKEGLCTVWEKTIFDVFFVISYHLMNFEIIHSWLVVRKSPSGCSVL